MVLFDPASQWYNASLTIAARWLREGGVVEYYAFGQSPEDARSQIKRLGVNTDELEKNDRLQIYDYYTSTLGQKSKERYAPPSLKVADLSIWMAKGAMLGVPSPDVLVISDNISVLDRFNDERTWVEFNLARVIPARKFRKITGIRGFLADVHSKWAYKNLEAAADGIIDFKLDDTGEQTKALMRIRSMRNVGFDSRWHSLKIGENFEVTLE